MNLPLAYPLTLLYRQILQNLNYTFKTTFSKPTFVFLNLTDECNSSCRMCWSKFRTKKAVVKELSTSQIKQIILQLKEWLGSFILTLAGGEPTLRKDVWELISYANNLGIVTVLSTNGSLIKKQTLPLIFKSRLNYIKISLDTLNPDTYYSIRGINFSKQVLQTLKLLSKYNNKISISVNTVITKHNVFELNTLAEFVKKNNLNSITFSPMVFKNFERKEFTSLWPGKAELEYSINSLIDLKRKGYPILNSIKHLNLIKDYYDYKTLNAQCSFLSSIVINTSGDMVLCSEKIGNIFKLHPKLIWDSLGTKELIKNLYDCKKSCMVMACNSNDNFIQKTKQFWRRYI